MLEEFLVINDEDVDCDGRILIGIGSDTNGQHDLSAQVAGFADRLLGGGTTQEAGAEKQAGKVTRVRNSRQHGRLSELSIERDVLAVNSRLRESQPRRAHHA